MPRKKKNTVVEEKNTEIKNEPTEEKVVVEEKKPETVEEKVVEEPELVEKPKKATRKPRKKKEVAPESNEAEKTAEKVETATEEKAVDAKEKVDETKEPEPVKTVAPETELNEPIPECVVKEACECSKESVVAEEVPEKKGIGRKGIFAIGALCGLGLGLIFGSVGGTPNTSKVKGDYETISLYGSIAESVNADTKKKFEDAGLTLGLMSDDFLSHVGTAMPEIEVTTLDGDTLNLADYKGKRVILEAVSSGCVYSQKMSAEYLDTIIENTPDTVFLQYFLSEDEDAARSFYEAIGKDPRADMPVILGSEELTAWISSVDFIGFPSFYMFDEDGKLAGTVIGYMENGVFDGYYKLAFNDICKTYELTTDAGETIPEFSAKIKKARQYMSELTEIDVPKSYLNSVDFE